MKIYTNKVHDPYVQQMCISSVQEKWTIKDIYKGEVTLDREVVKRFWR